MRTLNNGTLNDVCLQVSERLRDLQANLNIVQSPKRRAQGGGQAESERAGEFYYAKRQTSKLPRRTEASSATGRQGRCFQYAPRGASMPAWTVIDRLSLGGFGTTLLRGERGR